MGALFHAAKLGTGITTNETGMSLAQDHIVLAQYYDESGIAPNTVTPATGFTQLHFISSTPPGASVQITHGVYWCRRGAGAIATNWSGSFSGSTAAQVISLVAYSGCKLSGSPINIISDINSQWDQTVEWDSLLPTVNGCIAVGFFANSPFIAVVPDGWDSERYDGGAAGGCVCFDDNPQAFIHATGARVTTLGSINPWHSSIVVLEPEDIPPDPAEPYLVAVGALQAEASTTALGPVVIPAEAALNDIMIVPLMLNAAGTFTGPGGGWAQIPGATAINSANQSTDWYWKRHDGSEADPTWTTSVTMSSTIGGYGRVYVFRNCITTGDPFEDVTMVGTPTSDTTPDSAAIDTTGPDRLVVSFVMVDDDNTWSSGNPPALWGICGSRASSTTGGDAMFDAISRVVAAAGSVAAVTIGTQSASDYWRTMTLALIPEPAAVAALPPRRRFVLPRTIRPVATVYAR